MTIQSNLKTRPVDWEEEAPPQIRPRRVRQGVSSSGQVLPGMPVEVEDPDGGEPVRSARARFTDSDGDWPRRPWWRPAGTVGRFLLGLGIVIVVGGLGVSIWFLRAYLYHDSGFRITGTDNIQATGLAQVSRSELLPVFGEDIGRNIFFVPLSQRRQQLEQLPWVQQATVMRLLPNQIRVRIVERTPVAFVRQGQQIGLVDANGVLLSMQPSAMAAHHYSFPVVTGIDPGDPAASRKARMAVYQRLMAELDSGAQKYSQEISEIDLTDPEDARVRMPEQGSDVLAHFGDAQFLQRYQRYRAHIGEWRQQYPHLAAVDLRYERQVVLDMDSGTTAAQPAADGRDAGSQQDASAPAAPKPSAGQHSGSGRSDAGRAAASKQAESHSAAHKSPAKPHGSRDEKRKHVTAQRAGLHAAGKHQGDRRTSPGIAAEQG